MCYTHPTFNRYNLLIKHAYSFICISLMMLPSITYTQPAYFPDRGIEWETRDPDKLGMNVAKLNEAVKFAQENEYQGAYDLKIAILEGFSREPYHYLAGPTKDRGKPAGVILKNGYIIAQWGDVTRVDMTFSITKSYLSTVAGLAWDAGLIQNLSDSVHRYVWDGTFEGQHNSTITWDHLLTQSSDWSGELFGMKDWADRPPRDGDIDDWKLRDLYTPGTVFEYNDVRVNVLAYSLLQIWREPLPKVLKEKIMDPIGASPTWRWYGYDHSFVTIDGLQVQSVSGGGHSGGGLFIHTLDHARFGLLFLNKGKWKDQQLISSAWIEKATQSSQANPNYGYMWWLNQPGDRKWDTLSENIYYAAGFGGNYIVIIPDHQMVIVTRWLDPPRIDTLIQKVVAANDS